LSCEAVLIFVINQLIYIEKFYNYLYGYKNIVEFCWEIRLSEIVQRPCINFNPTARGTSGKEALRTTTTRMGSPKDGIEFFVF